jgi:hypothetical protein
MGHGTARDIPRVSEEVSGLQSQTLEHSSDMMSFLEIKQLALKLLPHTSIFRKMILSEPDMLPRIEASAKLEIYVKLLYSELRNTNANE